MLRRILPGTELEVSRACLGTMALGSHTDEATSLRMIDMALDAGVDFFDTANGYGRGASETVLGKAFKGRRDEVVVATKVRARMGDEPDQVGLSAAAIRRALDESLRRLQMDYVDVYYLHSPDYDVPVEESLGALDEAVRAGKVRYPATSNYSSWQVLELLTIAEANGYRSPTISQPMYNVLARELEREFLPMAARFGVATVVYNPLAGGLLSGKHRQDAAAPGSRFDLDTHQNAEIYRRRYWHDQQFRAIEELREVARDAGRSLIGLALTWLLHHSAVDCVILGSSRPEQLAENLAAFELGPLPDEAVAGCDRVWQELSAGTPPYNR